MKQDFKNLKDGQIGIWLIIKGMLGLLFRPLLDIWNLFKKEIIDNLLAGKWKELGLAVIPLGLIIAFVLYGFWGLGKDIERWWNSERYQKVIVDTYKKDIENFFKKYEERYLEHDCGFMRGVGADELMFDKYGHTSYGSDYKCTFFDKVQRVKLLPIEIGQIETAGKKMKVQGEMIRVDYTNGQPLVIAPIKFELWKTIDMDLWHFNLYGKPEDRWIDSVFKDYK